MSFILWRFQPAIISHIYKSPIPTLVSETLVAEDACVHYCFHCVAISNPIAFPDDLLRRHLLLRRRSPPGWWSGGFGYGLSSIPAGEIQLDANCSIDLNLDFNSSHSVILAISFFVVALSLYHIMHPGDLDAKSEKGKLFGSKNYELNKTEEKGKEVSRVQMWDITHKIDGSYVNEKAKEIAEKIEAYSSQQAVESTVNSPRASRGELMVGGREEPI
ncbi:hypothetical protein Ahy_A08g038160 isoform B [Arachis hypogaea]|uniref:Uncharacterized protein n=1 Tax=Arachis hypogaea TaxID=3818 RepID=A0A445BSR9_ARAHY|nr:hypothetical protein Ahy_A08g038160 isoform B [Arachis hypogaea]